MAARVISVRRRKALTWLACGLLLLVIAGAAAAVGFGPLVRRAAQSRAARRGVTLEIDRIRPGWLSVRLLGVRARIEQIPSVTVKLSELRVRATPWLRVRGLEMSGGSIDVEGSLEAVKEEVRAFRRRGADGPATSPSSNAPYVKGQDLNLEWRGLEGEGEPARIERLHFERRGDAVELGLAQADLRLGPSRWTLRDVTARLARAEGHLALSNFVAGEAVARVALRTTDSAGVPVDRVTPPTPTAIATRSSRRSPGGRAAAAPAAPPGRSDRFRKFLSQGAHAVWSRRQQQLAKLRELLSQKLSPGATIESPALRIELSRGRAKLGVGPAPFHLTRKGDELETAFSPPPEENGKRLAVTGKLPLSPDPVEVSFEGGPISLRTLGVKEHDFGLLGVGSTQLSLSTELRLDSSGMLDISASGQLAGLSLQQASLAPEPLRGIDLSWGGRIELDMGKRRLKVSAAELQIERVRMEADVEMSARDDDLRVQLEVRVPTTPCEDLYEAAPEALLPLLEGLRLGGEFGLAASVAFDTAAPKDTRVDWDLGNRCKVRETPAEVDPKRFAEPFQHFVIDADGAATEIETGPSTDRWVPLSDISPNMETALVVCEDSRFFRHRGFDDKSIRDSIVSNLKAGRFVRGGSTLTMQLAKNLYLSREKTLSRKLQEAVLTLLLEERLSKQDILELYLNVVEFGPGIYGIREAAEYYFDSHPGELSLAQALFFGSILPRPKAEHFEEGGALDERWTKHLRYLMRIAHKIHRISDDELEAGLSEQLHFGQPHVEPEIDFLFGAPLFELSDG